MLGVRLLNALRNEPGLLRIGVMLALLFMVLPLSTKAYNSLQRRSKANYIEQHRGGYLKRHRQQYQLRTVTLVFLL
jgi:hypothetical protein